jgi:hypothetical protein
VDLRSSKHAKNRIVMQNDPSSGAAFDASDDGHFDQKLVRGGLAAGRSNADCVSGLVGIALARFISMEAMVGGR